TARSSLSLPDALPISEPDDDQDEDDGDPQAEAADQRALALLAVCDALSLLLAQLAAGLGRGGHPDIQPEGDWEGGGSHLPFRLRSEEHTSELQSRENL